MNNGQTQRQEGSGRPREMTEREDKSIVRATLRDLPFSSILRVAGTSVITRTINSMLIKKVQFTTNLSQIIMCHI